MPGPQLSFRASAHEYIEKFNTSAVQAVGTSAVDLSPTNNQVQSYGFLRRIKIRQRNSVAASSGGTLAADGPWNFIQQLQLTDPNGAEIYGGPTWGGYETMLAEKYGTYKANNDPAVSTLFGPAASNTTTPLVLWTIPLELAESSGYGSLPNFDAQSPYKLKAVLNTTSGAYTTAPTTTNPSVIWDYIIECWTLPDAVNKLSGLAQQQFPPGIGPLPGIQGVGCTVQHWTKSNPVITANSAVAASFIRKGNTYRNVIMVVRQTTGAARVATTNFPNPLTFALDGAPLWNSIDPAVIVELFWRREGSAAPPGGAVASVLDTGVVPIIYGAIDADNNAGSDGTLGSQGWLGNNQASRIEASGTWGASANILDVLTNDVNAVSLEGSAYAYSFGTQLAAPSQPSVRTG
jgi:hypothetical protein